MKLMKEKTAFNGLYFSSSKRVEGIFLGLYYTKYDDLNFTIGYTCHSRYNDKKYHI